MSNNPPDIQVGFSKEEAEFIVNNCETNIRFGLMNLQKVSKETAKALVEQIEMFKKVMKAVEKAQKDA